MGDSSPASRDAIITFLDELLDAQAFDDYGPNGLQVPGAEEVAGVVTGVSASLELFEAAVASGAGLVLCHHGLFWGAKQTGIDPVLKQRLKALFDADVSLAAYHLPLDAHPEVGNNALICGALGFEPSEPIGSHGGRAIGRVGRTAQAVPIAELGDRCRAAFGREPLVFAEGPGSVGSIGVVSGGGASDLREAAAMGLDAFLTGEPAEPSMAEARETQVNFLACGHYATERFGVRKLGEILEERFDLEHRFVEITNPA